MAIFMSVKALKCPSCGAPLGSTDVTKCGYCGSTLVYSVPQQVFRTVGEEGAFRGIARNVEQRLENGYTVLAFRIEQIDNEGNIQILSNEEVIVSNNNEFEDFLKRTSRIENLTLKAQEQVIKTGGSGLIDVPQIRPRH